MRGDLIRWYIADRGHGKTTDLITWVKLGNVTTSYPGWSRIILEPTQQMADQLRGGSAKNNKYGLDYHQVFYWDEWVQARGRMLDKVEIGLDNADIILNMIFHSHGVHGQITRVTATGDALRWPELLERDKSNLYIPRNEISDRFEPR